MAPAEPPIPFPPPTALPSSPRFHVEIDLRPPPVCLRPKKLLIYSIWIALIGLLLLVAPVAASSETMALLAAASFSSLLLLFLAAAAAAVVLALHDFSWFVCPPGDDDCEVVVREAGGGGEEAISWIISFETAKAPPLLSSYEKAAPSRSTEAAESEASVEVVLLVAAEAAFPSSA